MGGGTKEDDGCRSLDEAYRRVVHRGNGALDPPSSYCLLLSGARWCVMGREWCVVEVLVRDVW